MYESIAGELWLPVPDAEDERLISNQGRVWSVERTRLGRRPCKVGGCLLSPVKRADGYLHVLVGRRIRMVHHLVLEAFVGPRPAGTEGCHNNGDRTDNRLINLRWDTRTANAWDAIEHGTHHRAARTHCPRGHELNELNNMPSRARRGGRECLACSRARGSAQSARKRGKVVDLYATADEHYARIVAQRFS